jgi:hypothetical protein
VRVTVLALSLTGCQFGVQGLSINGEPPDLADPSGDPPDLSVSPDPDGAVPDGATPDLAMDLAAPADLAQPPDLLPMCLMPTIASTVGPGPNLSITLSKVKLNGSGKFAHIAPGATFSLTADYSLSDNGNNVDQILIGVAPNNTALACLFNATVSGGGASGTATVMLTAPTQPGSYTLRFHYGQAISCDLSWWTVNGAPSSAEDFASFCVP